MLFFFKLKTAYEFRISDWSSDVCSSDLHDDGGWLQDVALLDHLVTEKLTAEAEQVAAEGWKWIEVATEFPYGHVRDLRDREGVPVEISADDQAAIDALNVDRRGVGYGKCVYVRVVHACDRFIKNT